LRVAQTLDPVGAEGAGRNRKRIMSSKIHKGLLALLLLPAGVLGQHKKPIQVQYGIASYYADKFEGRKTYTDEIFSQDSLTAASNTLPMHTWVKVTNLRNHRTVIVQINDKMHPRNRRLIDLSRAAAAKLGFAGRGLVRVRVDVITGPFSHRRAA
jgi:rare lipoprotein A (peptidoglycan hydrolase)